MTTAIFGGVIPFVGVWTGTSVYNLYSIHKKGLPYNAKNIAMACTGPIQLAIDKCCKKESETWDNKGGVAKPMLETHDVEAARSRDLDKKKSLLSDEPRSKARETGVPECDLNGRRKALVSNETKPATYTDRSGTMGGRNMTSTRMTDTAASSATRTGRVLTS